MFYALAFVLIFLACIATTVVKVIKKRKEEKDSQRDSIIYDENGVPRFGNIPYKYSHRKRGLTIGEQYTKAGGTQNPSAVRNPQFVPGRESYRTMERATIRTKKERTNSGHKGDDSSMFDDGSITIGV
jgi:hypothetical protein